MARLTPVARRAGELAALPPGQARIARLLVRGYTNKEIASALGIGVQTVKEQMRRLMIRTGTRNRVELARWYWEREREVQT